MNDQQYLKDLTIQMYTEEEENDAEVAMSSVPCTALTTPRDALTPVSRRTLAVVHLIWSFCS